MSPPPFLSRRFFSTNSPAMVANVFAPSSACANFAAFLTAEGSRPRAKLRLASSRASRASFRSDLRINADRERLLSASESVSESPPFRAIRRNPQLEPAAVRKLDDLRAGERALYSEIGKGHVGTNGGRINRIPTNVPTILLDARERGRTPPDINKVLSCCIYPVFGQIGTSSDVKMVPRKGTRTFTACTAGT